MHLITNESAFFIFITHAFFRSQYWDRKLFVITFIVRFLKMREISQST
ncbi:hypothetical protein BSM4216_3575 [Bacillus smithii]|nr:hypothetical protein BSM4216_3575 [Bacillus smithii]